jgi:hypothetical protein
MKDALVRRSLIAHAASASKLCPECLEWERPKVGGTTGQSRIGASLAVFSHRRPHSARRTAGARERGGLTVASTCRCGKHPGLSEAQMVLGGGGSIQALLLALIIPAAVWFSPVIAGWTIVALLALVAAAMCRALPEAHEMRSYKTVRP